MPVHGSTFNAGTVQVRLFADTKKFMAGMGAAQASVGRMTSSVQKSAKIAVIAFAAITAAAGKMATQLDKRLREISTLIIGVTENDIRNMSREIRDLGMATGKAFDDIGKAKYDIISAGFTDLAESASVLNTASRLAVGGVTSVTKAADILTSALNSWGRSGFEAETAADTLFTTVRLGKTTIDELVSSMGRVFPTAAAVGASLKDVGAAMATITAGGIKSYEAATYLNQALTKLGAPSLGAARQMARYGIQIRYASDGSMKLLETLKQFKGFDLQQMRKFFPEIRAVKAILSMVNNLEFLERALQNVEEGAGANQTAFEKMTKAWERSLQRGVMEFHSIMVDMGNEVMPAVVDAFEEMVDILDKNSDRFVAMGKAVAAIVPLLTQIVANTPLIIGLVGAFKGLKAIGVSVGGAMAGVAVPISILIGAVATLVGGFVKLIQHIVKSRNELTELADESKVLAKDVPEGMEINPQALFDKNAPKFISERVDPMEQRVDIGMGGAQTYGELVPEKFDKIDFSFKSTFSNLRDEIKKTIDNAYGGVLKIYQSYEDFVKNRFLDEEDFELFDGYTEMFEDALDNIYNKTKVIGSGVVNKSLGLDKTAKQLGNFTKVLDDIDLEGVRGNADSIVDLFTETGINLSNYERAMRIIDALGIKMENITDYDLSALGIDTGKLEYAHVMVEDISDEVIKSAELPALDFGVRAPELITELEGVEESTERVKAELYSIIPILDDIGNAFRALGDTISSTMANSFAEMALSGRTAMKELEDYNKGLTSNFRTAAEIQEEAWGNMWNNILLDTARAVFEMIAKYTLLTISLIVLNAISGGMLAGALGIGEKANLSPDKQSDFWNFMGNMFSGAKESGFADMVLGDGVITPRGDVVQTSPDDYIMAMKRPEEMNLGGRGGDTYNVYTWDSQSLDQYLRRNAPALARGVGSAIDKRDLKLRPKGNSVKAEY